MVFSVLLYLLIMTKFVMGRQNSEISFSILLLTFPADLHDITIQRKSTFQTKMLCAAMVMLLRVYETYTTWVSHSKKLGGILSRKFYYTGLILQKVDGYLLPTSQYSLAHAIILKYALKKATLIFHAKQSYDSS